MLGRYQKPAGAIHIGAEKRFARPRKPEQGCRMHDGIDRRQR
jgi:hypothetical protein